MREITELMIVKYKLMKLKYDFMGYGFSKKNELSFHHTIIPHRYCKELGLGEGYLWWNGAILKQSTSHDYAHVIEQYDYDRFMALTSELIDENIKGHIDYNNLKAIDDILTGFEREYCGKRTNGGKPIIKEEYTNRLIKRW